MNLNFMLAVESNQKISTASDTSSLPNDLNVVVQQHEGNFKRLKKWMEKIDKKMSMTETMSIQLEQQHSEIEKLKSQLHRLTTKTGMLQKCDDIHFGEVFK